MAEWVIDASAEDGAIAPSLLRELEAVAHWTLARESAGDVELSIALVSDETISSLNEEYLSHEGPTDVISFPLRTQDALVGDLYVGYEQAARQAEEFGVGHQEELFRLVIHGTLHILGWVHPEEGERDQSDMYRRQEELLRSFLTERG